MLFPPAHAYYSTTPALKLFHDADAAAAASNSTSAAVDHPTMHALRVTQRAGDVLYVPALWGHATLNTQQSIGVAHEFSVESFCME